MVIWVLLLILNMGTYDLRCILKWERLRGFYLYVFPLIRSQYWGAGIPNWWKAREDGRATSLPSSLFLIFWCGPVWEGRIEIWTGLKNSECQGEDRNLKAHWATRELDKLTEPFIFLIKLSLSRVNLSQLG